MKIKKNENYTLVIADELFFNDFYVAFKKEYSQLKHHHLFLLFTEKTNIKEKDILQLITFSTQHKENGITFVVICTNVDVDFFPDTFNIVPTLEEAEDVLEMENIERELGF